MKRLEESRDEALRAPGDRCSILLAVFVRLCLVCHNVLTAWRVWVEYEEDNMYLLLLLGNVLIGLEGLVVIVRRRGVEYSWWCPCFLVYLLVTLPGVWLLQLAQTRATVVTTVVNSTAAGCPGGGTTASSSGDTTQMMTVTSTLQLDNDIWVIIIQEALVYLLILGRWMLPRGKVTRDFLADLLLEFLAIASDIMELLAIFDDDGIRSNVDLTHTILAVWSVSFIQFVPILMQRRRFKHIRTVNITNINRMCGDKFVEIVVTCMSIFLQDGPFLALRLYIMIYEGLITYSLIFFVVKNIVTLLLLFYRLVIVCHQLPCVKGQHDDIESIPAGMFGHPLSPMFSNIGHAKHNDALYGREQPEFTNRHADAESPVRDRLGQTVSHKLGIFGNANHDNDISDREKQKFTNQLDDLERVPSRRFGQHAYPRTSTRDHANHDDEFYERDQLEFINRSHTQLTNGDIRSSNPLSVTNPNYRQANHAHANHGYESNAPDDTAYSSHVGLPSRENGPNINFQSELNTHTPFARATRESRKFDFRKWQQQAY